MSISELISIILGVIAGLTVAVIAVGFDPVTAAICIFLATVMVWAGAQIARVID